MPLLGVLPGTGGLTRLVDKRQVRRDLTDVFATRAEGIRGQTAVDWGLVDAIAPPRRFAETVAGRVAAALAAPADPARAGAGATGIQLPPLQRNSGDVDSPRILGAFNERTPDWLAFFMFTYFTDRDGKFQLGTLKESAFDPLARTCTFMLREEAHHMFVGTTGVQRVLERTAALMREHDTEDVYPHGGIPLDLVQRYLNFHFAVSMDLFGSELSTNAANYFSAGLKGRWNETRRADDHRLLDAVARRETVRDGHLVVDEVAALSALNLDLRTEYVADCARGVKRWNQALAAAGLPHRLSLPHDGFCRRVGGYSAAHITPSGQVVDAASWEWGRDNWLPTADDRQKVAELMQPVYEPGRFAGWIAPPSTGINNQPVDFEYVRIA